MPEKGAAPVVPASGQLGALGVEIITQYAGQEQVDLAVLVGELSLLSLVIAKRKVRW